MEILWAFPCLVVTIIAHAGIMRLPIAGNSVIKFLTVGAVAGIGLATSSLLQAFPWTTTCGILLLFAFSCELYLFLFTLVSSSISVRLLLMLRVKALTEAEVDDCCKSTGLVDRRLSRLCAIGLLVDRNGGHVVSRRGRVVVSLFQTLRGFFGHDGDASAHRMEYLAPNARGTAAEQNRARPQPYQSPALDIATKTCV